MEYRCVLCNEVISEEEISGAVDYAAWGMFGFGEDSVDEEGQLIPPKGSNWNVTWTHRWGWVHEICQWHYGTGVTPEAWATQMVEDMKELRLYGHLRELLVWLLALHYTPAPRLHPLWYVGVAKERRSIREILDASPSLVGIIQTRLAEAYDYAREGASEETGLPLVTFPETCSWPAAQVLDADFWPEP